MIETNLTGPWLMSTLEYNMWMRDNGGSIVVITAAPHDRVGDPVPPINVCSSRSGSPSGREKSRV